MDGLLTVGFKPTRKLGIRLSPLGSSVGAVFDGWSPDKQSEGENHEDLQVGDRLVKIGDHDVHEYMLFDEITGLLRQVIRCELYGRGREEGKAQDDELVYGKYDLRRPTVVSKRIKLVFKKRRKARDITVNQNILNVWFRPATGSVFGVRFVGLANTANDQVKELFQDIIPGSILVGVNNRSVEGLRFDLAIDSVQQSSLPVVLRFAEPEEEKEEREEEGKRMNTEAEAKREQLTDDIMGKSDAHHKVTKIPFTLVHLDNFFRSIREGDRDYFLGRLQAGQDLGARDTNGDTPLLCAARMKDGLFFVEHLLAEGVFVDDTDIHDGKSALHIAAGVGNVDMIKLLCLKGSDVNQVDHDGRTPLMDAISKQRVHVVKFLLRSGSNLRLRDQMHGWNCLHHAALSGREDIVQLLLDSNKIDIHSLTEPGAYRPPKTALDIARDAGHELVSGMLHEHIMEEPIHRIWPHGGDWIVMDETITTPDLMWRTGPSYTRIDEVESRARSRTCERLNLMRVSKPPGNHDEAALKKRENTNQYEKDMKHDKSKDGELFIGSLECLTQFWCIEQKDIDAYVIVDPSRMGGFIENNRWLKDYPHIYLHPAPSDFKTFAQDHMAKLVQFIGDQLKRNRRVLIAATNLHKEDPLHYPTAIALAAIIITFQIKDYDDIADQFDQNCYFYSVQGARKKRDWLSNLKKGAMTADEVAAIRKRHNVKKNGRTKLINIDWENGLRKLQDHVYQRQLNATRRRTAQFRTNFVM